MKNELVLSVTDFVGLCNQTLEYAYPSVTILGELANFRISKNRWIYFDLKDEHSSVGFFGTTHQLSGPLEDGLMLQVRGVPRLHPRFGFSINVQFMSPVGEGSLKKAAALLEAKLAQEGLFAPERKRSLPYPPGRVGLITSGESAAYHDFIKIINERWFGIEVILADVQVQGESAPEQLVAAIDYFNTHTSLVDALVIVRGGGSSDDLAAFSTETVTRAVAGSRVPTLVAIGHEIDLSLAEMAADKRASTPSNAVQLLVPDKNEVLSGLELRKQSMTRAINLVIEQQRQEVSQSARALGEQARETLDRAKQYLSQRQQVLNVLSPQAALKRGYAVVRNKLQVITSVNQAKTGDPLGIQMVDGNLQVEVVGSEVG